MQFYRRLSFQKKLLIFMMAMILFMGGAMGLLIRFVIFPYLTREMETRGINVARRLAESSRTYMLTRDTVRLTGLLFEEKYLEDNIAYILIRDENQRVLAHTFVGFKPEELRADTGGPIAWADDGSFSGPVSRMDGPDGQISHITVPVYEGYSQVGTIHVGLDRRFIGSVIHKLGIFHLGFIGFITLVGLLFGVYLSRFITRPITSLTQLVGEISQGNLNTQIDFDFRQHCWAVLQCNKPDCPAYGNETVRCWFVDDTLCKAGRVCKVPEKFALCKDCSVYKTQAGDEITQLADAFNHMTQRMRQSETELRRSEERYRFLFNNEPNPIFVIHPDTYAIRDANDRAVERYGYSKTDLLAMKFVELGLPEDASQIMAALSGVEMQGKPCMFLARVRHRTKAGQPFWVNINFCCYEHQDERGIIATTADISEIVDTETKLIQAGKMATLGEMAAGVAHELNQPLNAIKVGSDYLQVMMDQNMRVPEEDLPQVVQEMSNQVDRAAGIISRLREFGRKSEVARHPVDINRPIRGVFALLGQQLKVHGIEVILDLDDTLPPVLADENRIEQVLINLITNARDSMDEKKQLGIRTGAHRITIKSFMEGDRVKVTVTDTGMGIPEAARDRIFDPFFTTKALGKGTGLGLSISYGILRDFEGTIDFRTQEKVGTTFRLSFPTAPDKEGGSN